MPRCPVDKCGAALLYEPELANTAARWRCMACGWMASDPNFRKEQPRYFSTEAVDRWIGWKKEHPEYDLYCPRSAAAQLHISESFFRESVKKDPKAPVIMGRGVIACNTPALQEWWDGKNHHRVTGEG
jgi:hypothetical protein